MALSLEELKRRKKDGQGVGRAGFLVRRSRFGPSLGPDSEKLHETRGERASFWGWLLVFLVVFLDNPT